MLSQVLDSYPRPLLPAMPDADLSARETANLLGVWVSTCTRASAPARFLPDKTGVATPSRSQPSRRGRTSAPPIRSTLTPSPDSRVVWARSLDLLEQARSERTGTVYSEGLHREEHQVALTSTVLAVAASAARTAVTASHLDDVDRPLAVARYATAAVDTWVPQRLSGRSLAWHPSRP